MTVKVVITGSDGLLGQHAYATLLSENAHANFSGSPIPWAIELVNRVVFNDSDQLSSILQDAELVLHFAGVNRGEPDVVERDNLNVAKDLVAALGSENKSFLIYANSIHSTQDSPYGRGKKAASNEFEQWSKESGSDYCDLLLPNVFGEGGRPNYNTVTSTFCDQIINNAESTVSAGSSISLLHAGRAIDQVLELFNNRKTGQIELSGTDIDIKDLYDKLVKFHEMRENNVFPVFENDFDVSLYQTLLNAQFPNANHKTLDFHTDVRGTLFEVAKGGNEPQTFLSWTEPGMERGNHFHRFKVERFVVLEGSAVIRIRNIFEEVMHEYHVDGATPVAIDMPSLHTHSIENIGKKPMLTLFWAHEIFDPENPDTFGSIVKSDISDTVVHYF